MAQADSPRPWSRTSSLGRLLAMVVAGAGLYGAAVGAWNGQRMAIYAAAKLPLVLLVTGALTFCFNLLAAILLGAPPRPREVAALTLGAMALTAVLLASLAPVVLLADLTLPRPSTAERTTHNLLYLLHTGLVGSCGLAGTAALWRSLERWTRSRSKARKILSVWLLSLALVGGEVAWALRPFVGSVYEPIAFLRQDAFDGNVYEFIASDILPYLLRGGTNAAPEEGDEP